MATYYVATTGSNSNAGTIGSPWLTWQYAFNRLSAGDTLYLRGGTYTATAQNSGTVFGVRVDGINGTSGSHITVSAYNSEVPILDCSTLTSTSGQNVGFGFYNCSYWDFKGLNITNCTQHAVNAYNAQAYYFSNVYHINIELCTSYHNGDSFALKDGYDDIHYLNCDAYECADTYDDPSGAMPGSLSNGFYCAPSPGTYVYYEGCRAWNCSDDGWDFYGGSGYIEIKNCWAINNGYTPAIGPIDETFGDGSGFKLGPSTTLETGYQRILKNCLAIENYGPGIDINRGGYTNVRHAILNCVTAYNTTQPGGADGMGFQYWGDNLALIRNCISFANTEADEFGPGTTHDHNSGDVGTATAIDFISVDVSLLKGARQADGSLPKVTAFHLTTGSDLIGKGVTIGTFSNVTALTTDGDGISYGTPPSIGAFEYDAVSGNIVLDVNCQTLAATYSAVHTDPTDFTFSKNQITTSDASGYLLEAGDEVTGADNNNLDAAIITGNKFIWSGVPGVPITHGIFLGYNINDVVKYNYLTGVPYGIVIKSGEYGTNMVYLSGGVAYNVIRNSKIGVRIKGMDSVVVYGNTFYDNLDVGDMFIYITDNPDESSGTPSVNTKIKNNIFYSTTQLTNIYLEAGCETSFECDYNLYYCEAGDPMFNYGGAAKTFAQWQALGYDTHSVVVDPSFNNTTDLVPTARLDYGTALNSIWLTGLATNAAWSVCSMPATNNQNGLWQVGTFIYSAAAPIPVTNVTVSAPAVVITTDQGTLQATAHIDPHNATDQTVKWSIVNGTGQATITPSGLVTAVKNGTVTIKAISNG